MRPAVFTWPATDADGICVAQTLGAAGALTINGALLDPALATIGVGGAVMPGIERVLTAHSTGNIATVTFTITGKNLRGATVTDTITGVNNSTVAGTVPFNSVSSITASAAVGTAVEIGTGETGSTNWYITDYFAETFNIGWFVDVTSGTVDVDLQYTPDDVQSNSSPNVVAISSTIAADTAGVFTTPCRAIRATYGGTTNTGGYALTLTQTG